MEPRKQTIELAGKTLTLETGVMAKQSAGSVTITYGDTVVLCAVNAEPEPRVGLNFFLLSVWCDVDNNSFNLVEHPHAGIYVQQIHRQWIFWKDRKSTRLNSSHT